MDTVFLHLGSLNTLGLNWFWPGRSCVSRAMAKRSWPFGVTSWDDTVKFAQLLFGVDVAFENYAERLPHRSSKSFLLFAKGACAEGRPFFEIGDFIAPQLEEIQRWEENVRNNNARPTKSQQMLNADGWTVYYWSNQTADVREKQASTPKEPWQRDHGHLVSRVGMTQWSCLGESDMCRGMDTKKSCGIWFGWNILCLKQRIWFASSLSIQLHKILVCWIQFDWRVVHKWFRLSLWQVHAWNCNGRFDSQSNLPLQFHACTWQSERRNHLWTTRLSFDSEEMGSAVNSGKFLLAGLVHSVGFNCFWAGRAASGGRKVATKDSC